MRNEKRFLRLILIAAASVSAACETAPTNSSQNANAATAPIVTATANSGGNSNPVNTGKAKPETHEHVAPHGGSLIAFGEEFAHLELVLDTSNGQLTAYALDGEAENPVRISQTEIEIAVEKPRKFTVRLEATENALTGEKKGATSEFRGQSDELRNLNEFDAAINSITIRGREFKKTPFNFPKGNENEHRH